jgi:hypothetical protein
MHEHRLVEHHACESLGSCTGIARHDPEFTATEHVAGVGMDALNTRRAAKAVGSPALVSFLFILINRRKTLPLVCSTKNSVSFQVFSVSLC